MGTCRPSPRSATAGPRRSHLGTATAPKVTADALTVVGPEAVGGGVAAEEAADGVEASSEAGSGAAGPEPPVVQWRQSRTRRRWS